MKIYPISKDNNLFAFEIDSSKVNTKQLKGILGKTADVTNVRCYGILSGKGDTRCEFYIKHVEFEVVEDYGDSSRYWIGPKNKELVRCELVEILQNEFEKFSPPFWSLKTITLTVLVILFVASLILRNLKT